MPCEFGGPISGLGALTARAARRALARGVEAWLERHRCISDDRGTVEGTYLHDMTAVTRLAGLSYPRVALPTS